MEEKPEKPKPAIRRAVVLNKLNTENLQLLERGLLGDLPERFKNQAFTNVKGPVRGDLNKELVVAKPTGILASCLPVVPDSPSPSDRVTSSDDDSVSPLKKSFSFRDRFSRISFFGKDKHEKPKCKTIEEDDKTKKAFMSPPVTPTRERKYDHDHKSNKRFWFFRHKDMAERRQKQRPAYTRSKSFEFLPRALHDDCEKKSKLTKNSSYAFGSSDTMEAWSSCESLENISNVYYDNDDTVFLKSFKEIPADESSNKNSSISTVNSASSGIVINVMKTESVQDLLDEFEKTVDMFSENYMSDCEPYTKTYEQLSKKEKRKSSSFTTLPSPKVVQVTKLNEISNDFKTELSKLLEVKRASNNRSEDFKTELAKLLEVRGASVCPKTARRGSVTDWFVLEDKAMAASCAVEENKYRRASKKQMKRVRRISSTKYWITPEECEVYSRERRPPLVIPRISQYRAPRRETRPQPQAYPEDSLQDVPAKSWNWSPTSERSRGDLDRSFSIANSDSPPFGRINKRLGGSTENLLANSRRPNYLQLPPSSSGDSLDVEVRREPGYPRNRKSKSMVAPKHRMRSPVPAPRMLIHQPAESSVILETTLKRTKFSENGKKCKKNWTECYMILTSTALYFYKDQRTYQATKVPKPPGTPPSPTAPRAELVLPLRYANIVQCIQMHTRRYTRSVVLTVRYDQYLLQVDSEEGAKQLLKCILNVIYKLGPPIVDEYTTPQYQSSNTDLESLGRTPPASRHADRNKPKAGGSSNEDLSDPEAPIQKSHVKSRLRKFFAKRPAMEVLVKKGIYKDEPVFGRKLDEVCPATSPRVPVFVVACVREIESSEENMCTDGLYRASGNLSQVQKIRLEIDQHNLSVIENSTDIHVLTGSLKLFFRELKQPLIPCNMFDRVLAACSIKPREARVKEFRDIVQSLPPCNRDTLKFLLEHLLRVTEYSERNRMHTANLAIVFGPTLLWAPEEQAHNIAIDCIQQNNVVEILLNDFKDIFGEEPAKGKKKA